MSEQRKVCLPNGATTLCGKPVQSAEVEATASPSAFKFYASCNDGFVIACEACAARFPERIVTVMLCGTAFHGALDAAVAEARSLLAAALAGDLDAAQVLADAVEKRGAVEVDWPEARPHEHTWMRWRSGGEDRLTPGMLRSRAIRRCTCGLFEHEVHEHPRLSAIGVEGMSWTEAERHWPGCSVMFAIATARETWTPILRDRHGTLWADDMDCVERTYLMGQNACRCVAWAGRAWVNRIAPDRIREAEERHARRMRRQPGSVRHTTQAPARRDD